MSSTELLIRTSSASCLGLGFTSLLITSTISGEPSITQSIAKVRCDGLATADRGIMAAFLTPLYLSIKENVLCIVSPLCSQWLSLTQPLGGRRARHKTLLQLQATSQLNGHSTRHSTCPLSYGLTLQKSYVQ